MMLIVLLKVASNVALPLYATRTSHNRYGNARHIRIHPGARFVGTVHDANSHGSRLCIRTVSMAPLPVAYADTDMTRCWNGFWELAGSA